jgi:uncharacterized repeat protein (TIGR01451 family)
MLILGLLVTFATQRLPMPATAQELATLTPTNSPQTGDPGDTVTFTLNLTNNSGNDRIFNITVDQLPTGGFAATTPAPISVANGSTEPFSVQVSVPAGAAPGSYPSIRVEATAQAASGLSSFDVQSFVTLIVSGATFTPTPTRTTVAGPTNTPAPLCQDGFEGDNDRGSAKVIDVNTTQQRTICPAGDQDWLVFGGVGGKAYTVDISQMSFGLDLSLELFNEQGLSLAFNDDFFNREPPDPNDLRPRMSFTIPVDGRYYILVRDTANRGNANYFYTIALIGEATGPTPTTVASICLDLFEPDGLPEQARLITSNELQEDRRLCPDGDADWVYFFGKTGKRYFIFTDTRRYRGPNQVNQDTQAGADTEMLLTDRDGVSQIDFNDDIPGSETLDSQIEFIPSVDGFYYVQVKNVGDIGNQFIRYDLTLQLCVPGQTDCGRSSTTPIRPTPATEQPTVATPFTLPTSTPTSTNALEQVNTAQAANFADVAFQQVWQRSDLPVASQRVIRTWIWGPDALAIHNETYNQSATGTRLVQYFDKARMEINDLSGDRSSPWFVTNGLLVKELISGQMQIGDNEFTRRRPATIVLAGDADDATAPTYASLRGLLGESFADRTGSDVLEALDRSGQIGRYTGPRLAAASLVRYLPETGHNIPAIFWQFLNEQGEIYERGRYADGPLVNWLSAVGYPLTEPYWMRVQVGGVSRDVLVQAFERRVLTYTPDNPSGWQVEMGNVGRHYYAWRYGQSLP